MGAWLCVRVRGEGALFSSVWPSLLPVRALFGSLSGAPAGGRVDATMKTCYWECANRQLPLTGISAAVGKAAVGGGVRAVWGRVAGLDLGFLRVVWMWWVGVCGCGSVTNTDTYTDTHTGGHHTPLHSPTVPRPPPPSTMLTLRTHTNEHTHTHACRPCMKGGKECVCVVWSHRTLFY